MYPELVIDKRKLKENIDVISNLVKGESSRSLTMVSKCFCAEPEIVEVLCKHPEVDYIADSRVSNLKKNYQMIHENGKKSILLRLPMMCELEELVHYADISQNSELSTIEAINEEAKKQGKMHGIVLMIDLGDLREGIFFENKEEILKAAMAVEAMENVELVGVGTNLTCYGTIIPTSQNLSVLCEIAEDIEGKIGRKLEMVSGGASSSLYLIEEGDLPERINNLRIGEGFLLGRETAYGEHIPQTFQSAFVLKAQIIEKQEKPSYPIGLMGMDAFGKSREYEDLGIRTRVILAIGKQDVDLEGLTSLESGVRIMGGSSDHMILDVTESKEEMQVGNTVKFLLDYGALLQVFTSPYVEKRYLL